MTYHEMSQVLTPDAGCRLHDEVSLVVSSMAAGTMDALLAEFRGVLVRVEDDEVHCALKDVFEYAIGAAVEAGFTLGITGKENPAILLFKRETPVCVRGTGEGLAEVNVSALESILA